MRTTKEISKNIKHIVEMRRISNARMLVLQWVLGEKERTQED